MECPANFGGGRLGFGHETYYLETRFLILFIADPDRGPETQLSFTTHRWDDTVSYIGRRLHTIRR